MIISTYPATFHELGWANAEREGRPWYLIDRDGVIGLTAIRQAGDDVISTYDAD